MERPDTILQQTKDMRISRKIPVDAWDKGCLLTSRITRHTHPSSTRNFVLGLNSGGFQFIDFVCHGLRVVKEQLVKRE